MVSHFVSKSAHLSSEEGRPFPRRREFFSIGLEPRRPKANQAQGGTRQATWKLRILIILPSPSRKKEPFGPFGVSGGKGRPPISIYSSIFKSPSGKKNNGSRFNENWPTHKKRWSDGHAPPYWLKVGLNFQRDGAWEVTNLG